MTIQKRNVNTNLRPVSSTRPVVVKLFYREIDGQSVIAPFLVHWFQSP